MKVTFSVSICVKQPVCIALWCVGAMGSPLMANDLQPAQREVMPQLTSQCEPLLDYQEAWRGLQTAKAQLQSQGMALMPQACPFVRVGDGDLQQVLDVRVRVTDSMTASHFVRGPLADGVEVDMGPASQVFSSEAHDAQFPWLEDVSPDVQFNRHWLASLMHARGWHTVAGYWWAFVPEALRPQLH